MSYICLIANSKGIAASGDSRITMSPKALNLHFDKTRKVFQDEKLGLIWACCGLTIFGGVNYFRVVEKTLRTERMSMGAKLNRISTMMKRATKAHHLLSRGESAFTLLMGSVKAGEPEITVLKVMNGSAEMKTVQGAYAVEDGSVSVGALPTAEELEKATLENVLEMVRCRAMCAVKRSAEEAKEDRKKKQTVGGNVRVVYMQVQGMETN